MNRPLIGITTYFESTRFAVYDTLSAVLPWTYVEHVHSVGGRAVMIPPDPDGGVEVMESLDGLILAGGADVEPYRYGEQPSPHLGTTSRERDTGELPLARHALRYGLPLLGVCRGMQVMAVASGGKLIQHLPEALGTDAHRIPGPHKRYAEHAVRFAPGSRCREMFQEEAVVNSYHHQGVSDPGRLVATGWCVKDDLIEAVEHPDHPFAVGVQWHPEDMKTPLFAALVTAAAQTRSARSALVTV